ncbi:relaxase/mobilization nuclease domain-containing protein [Aeromonas salmonicida]
MNSEKFKFTKSFRVRVNYGYRVSDLSMKMDAPLNIRHLGGNLMAFPNAAYNSSNEVISYNIEPIIKELEQQADLYVGSGELLCAHYVLTLPKDDMLDELRWSIAARSYMNDMGYGDDTKWTSVIHDDTEAEHLHIIACRVRFNRTLVNDKNDYERGIKSVREIEKKLGLSVHRSPEENFGIEYSVNEMKSGRGRETEAAYRDPGHIIRSALESVFEDKPKKLYELVVGLREHNVMTSVYREHGCPRGISYSTDGKTWISGSKIKRQRATWGRLLEQGLEYIPARDDKWLNLGGRDINNNATLYYFSALIRCTEKQYKRIKVPIKTYVYKPKGLSSERIIQLDFVAINELNFDNGNLAKLFKFLFELLTSIFKKAVLRVCESLSPTIPAGFTPEIFDGEQITNKQHFIKESIFEQARRQFINENDWVVRWFGSDLNRNSNNEFGFII